MPASTTSNKMSSPSCLGERSVTECLQHFYIHWTTNCHHYNVLGLRDHAPGESFTYGSMVDCLWLFTLQHFVFLFAHLQSSACVVGWTPALFRVFDVAVVIVLRVSVSEVPINVMNISLLCVGPAGTCSCVIPSMSRQELSNSILC